MSFNLIHPVLVVLCQRLLSWASASLPHYCCLPHTCLT